MEYYYTRRTLKKELNSRRFVLYGFHIFFSTTGSGGRIIKSFYKILTDLPTMKKYNNNMHT
jgi:hypothetical protein